MIAGVVAHPVRSVLIAEAAALALGALTGLCLGLIREARLYHEERKRRRFTRLGDES